MSPDSFIRDDVRQAKKKGLIMCPCTATYSIFLKRCPKCGRPNPEKFRST